MGPKIFKELYPNQQPSLLSAVLPNDARRNGYQSVDNIESDL